ncbi:conserved hypothetical protein [Beutenbergia cavernae DSM 12333]|uniref:DUF4383 domain-containing protein n=1 Tax=Beutenbergia cavernae (strain ATCC BAA-8 / DSM 12333 / CCUG 43141 / JCM 11478 / NBRC 16432 / NCIMB 13614 / HKI 0122) TaxID=471853 RepID=C5C0K6_BEUC1|nr:DUF4383 domain-containing protein [Beutenbergia cavernae]ACQ81402.1 conserved hypothetical protein [Beutenbergia cavernae DSM 12333]
MSSSPNRLLAAIFGSVYLLVGLAGFAVTGGVGFAGTEGATLIVFDVNPLHNIVHVGIGAALLIASRSVAGGRATNTTIGAVYLLVGVLGLFLASSSLNILALNTADNVLHLASAVLLLAVGLSQDRAAVTEASA